MKDFLDQNFEALVILLGVLFLLLAINNFVVVITFILRPIKGFFSKRVKEKAQVSVLTKSESRKARKIKISPRFRKFFSRIAKFKNFRAWKLLFHTYTYYFINIILICLIWAVVYGIQYRQPRVLSSNPENGGQLTNPEDSISVQFSRPVNTTGLEMNLGPDVPGVWKREKLLGFLPLTTEMTFQPEETVLPDDDMILYVVNFNPVDIGEHLIEFKSAPLPLLKDANIEEDQEMVPVDTAIEFEFDKEIGNSVEYKVEVTPEFAFTKEIEGNKLRIIPETRLELNTEYKVKLFQSKVSYKIATLEPVEKTDPEKIYTLKFKTDKIALIKSVEPSGVGVLADAKAKIVFGKQVDKENIEGKIRFEPEVAFSTEWLSDTELVITPDAPFEKETKYQLILGEGIEYDQTQTMFDYNFDFETIGRVKVNKFSPDNGALGQTINISVRVYFNQEVNHESAQNAFEISPNVNGSFSWDGNSMIFKPSALGYQIKYTIRIKSGVKTINGLDSSEEFSTSFTTQSEITTISVPYYRQVQRFECEVLSFRMIMAHRGIYLSNSQVLSGVGIDSTPYNSANNTWGDPYSHFVGDITGASKGYGVHLQPLARVAQSYGRSTRMGSNWSVSDVTAEVSKGNPVMILAQNGYSTPTNISWRTPGGKYIHAINGTHAYVVVGYRGSASNPTSMLLQDPWYRGGSRRWFSMSYFNTLWAYHSNSALVVY